MNAYSYQFIDHEVTATFTQGGSIVRVKRAERRKDARKALRS